MYRNKQCPLCIEVICNTLRDCIIIKIKNSEIVVVAQYIPPSNSEYYSDIYMENLKLVYEKLSKKRLLLLGDLNARVGDIVYKDQSIKHNKNPDNTINSSGKKLLEWIDQRQDMVIKV